MSISDLKELIKDLPDDMQVIMPHGEETFITCCYEQSEVISFPMEDEEEEEGFSFMDVFVIRPCCCEYEEPVLPQEQILN